MRNIDITNPNKIMWSKLKIRKIDYITILYKLSSYILKYAKNRDLTVIRYPDGVEGKSFYQKNLPNYAPDWVEHSLDNIDILMWMGNQAALEFHTSFNTKDKPNNPSSLIFDLDPSKGQTFTQVVEVALLIHETLLSLNIRSYAKTSGATGIQIYIPVGGKYSYEEARKINEFFGIYFSQKYKDKITIERLVKNRNKKLYFDYLQMWKGKTIITPYSPRAVKDGLIATPVLWQELESGIDIHDFNLHNIINRIEKVGDVFCDMDSNIQDLDFILKEMSY